MRSWTYDFSITYPTPSQLSYASLVMYRFEWVFYSLLNETFPKFSQSPMSISHHYIDIKLMSQNYKFWLSQRVILMMSHWCQFDVSKIINSALPRESILRYQSDVYLLTYFIYCHDKPQNWCQNHINIMISFGCHIYDISLMSISWHTNLGSKFWYQFDINPTSRFVLVTYQWRVDVKVTLDWPKSDVTVLLETEQKWKMEKFGNSHHY